MLSKILNWLLGKNAVSTATGIASSTIAGAATMAAAGGVSKEMLIAGALSGAGGGIMAALGRGHGENNVPVK